MFLKHGKAKSVTKLIGSENVCFDLLFSYIFTGLSVEEITALLRRCLLVSGTTIFYFYYCYFNNSPSLSHYVIIIFFLVLISLFHNSFLVVTLTTFLFYFFATSSFFLLSFFFLLLLASSIGSRIALQSTLLLAEGPTGLQECCLKNAELSHTLFTNRR